MRYSTRSVDILCLLLLMVLLVSGCPVADPYTESRIINKTAKAIQVELVLDKNKYGVEQSDKATALAREWLEEFGAGEGVEILAVDTAGLSATYRIAAAGFMLAHAALGTKPYFYFKKLIIRQDDKTLVFDGEQEIVRQFRPKEGSYYRYEFQITDAVFNGNGSGSDSAAAPFDLLGNESLGQLRLGLSEHQMRAIVPGEPQKGEDVLWAATDEYGQEWHYPAQGITLQMMSATPGGEKAIGSITITAPSTLKSRRGIAIGSSQADVLQAYGELRAPDAEGFGQPGKIFVAGSIFGGMIFTFSDDKVSEIFLGAAAE